MSWDASRFGIWSLALLSLALLLLAALLVGAEIRRGRRSAVIGRAIRRGSDAPAAAATLAPGEAGDPWAPPPAPSGLDLRRHWLDSRLGRMLVADEDRKLIDQCGFPPVRAQLLLLVLRVALALGLPLLVALFGFSGPLDRGEVIMLAVGFAAGFLAPKRLLSGYAASRREQVARELPLFVDLLRLLQGVGLSLDQSLQIMATDFSHVQRALGRELALANRQYGQGRTREHSLQRLATVYDNDNLAGLVGLLVQIDRHGGAVQEPLRQFSERLREHRRAELKERVGKITVKMTGIMVTTLLPALIIVTAGPGFLAIVRSLGAMAK